MKPFFLIISLTFSGLLHAQDQCNASYYNEGAIGHILLSNQEVYSGAPVISVLKTFTYKGLSYIPAQVNTHTNGQGFVHDEVSYVIFRCDSKSQVAEFAIEATTTDLKTGEILYQHSWKADFTSFTLLDLQSNEIQAITLDDPNGFYPNQDTIGPVFDLQGEIKLVVSESKNKSGQYVYTYDIQNNTNYAVTILDIGNVQKLDKTESCELVSIPGAISVGEEIDDPSLVTPTGWSPSFFSCDGTRYHLSVENEDTPLAPTNKITIATIILPHSDPSYSHPHFTVYFAEAQDITTVFNGIAVSSNLAPKKQTNRIAKNKKTNKKQIQVSNPSRAIHRQGSFRSSKSIKQGQPGYAM